MSEVTDRHRKLALRKWAGYPDQLTDMTHVMMEVRAQAIADTEARIMAAMREWERLGYQPDRYADAIERGDYWDEGLGYTYKVETEQ